MYTILIVDDEPIIRKGIVNFIPWDSIDCKVIAEATNGLEAKEIIQTQKPDIIIADIKMPGINGIALCKYIYENTPEIKVVLLTGYSDFKYAQSAIKYNVVDFVLKPSSNEKIINAIQKAQDIIFKERSKEKKLIDLQYRLKDSVKQLQEKFFYDFINGILQNSEKIFSRIELLNIKLSNYYVLIFKINTNYNNAIMNVSENKKNILLEINKFISMIFKDHLHYNVNINSKSICTILNFKSNDKKDSINFILSKSQELLHFFDCFMNISISLGISTLQNKPEKIPAAYNEALTSLSQKFYDDNNIFTYSQNNLAKYPITNSLEHTYIDKIMNFVKLGNIEEAISIMKELFHELKTSRQSIGHIKHISILICSLLFKSLMNYNINLSETIENSSEIYKEILTCDSISKLSDILEKVILSITKHLSYLNSEDNYIIKKATDYIELNYQTPIKLSTLAKIAHVNSSYLSRLFKKETGATLTEIVTKIRIEKAKELLSIGNLKTYQVAINVGIEDPAYFSLVFKKYTGVSPSEFKRLN